MCRYAFKDYKSHFACFDCRKTFKKTSITDWTKQKGLDYAYKKLLRDWSTKNRKKTEDVVGTTYEKIRDDYLEDVATCPQCGGAMAGMGYDFKAPKVGATEEWEVIRALYDHGFAFHGCGCSVGYTPPKRISGLQTFFRAHGRLSEGQRLLERLNHSKA